jgi:hypothetical protein
MASTGNLIFMDLHSSCVDDDRPSGTASDFEDRSRQPHLRGDAGYHRLPSVHLHRYLMSFSQSTENITQVFRTIAQT